jgi:hypothetical protein
MKKIRLVLIIILVSLFAIVNLAGAQYGGYYLGTVYQVANPNNHVVSVSISYFDSSGNHIGANRTISNLPPGGSELIRVPVQETSLPSGMYSAVVGSSDDIQVIVNQEYYPVGNVNSPVPPFASYEGISDDAIGKSVYLTTVAYNYFNYYTDMVIMNTGDSTATVTIKYYPGDVNGVPTGSAFQEVVQIPASASLFHSQKSMSQLGAPSASGKFANRFLGTALLTSDKDIAVVVNEHNPSAYKLMSFNGVTAGATKVMVPSHMRGYYGYYTATQILNLSTTKMACVRLTYTPDTTRSTRLDGQPATPVTVEKTIKPMVGLQRYDGATASAAQSDLLDFSQFYGTLLVESITNSICSTAQELAVQVNTESIATGSSQSGAIMGIAANKATTALSLPNILSNYYGYYTSTQIMNIEDFPVTCTVKYTSGPKSAVPNFSKTYTHNIPANSVIDLYEGTSGRIRGDINTDRAWCASGACRFLGSAQVTCTGRVVSFTNEEKDINGKDSMYSWNDFNITPP